MFMVSPVSGLAEVLFGPAGNSRCKRDRSELRKRGGRLATIWCLHDPLAAVPVEVRTRRGRA